MQQVYTGNLNCHQGWNTFTFTTPFQYNGTDNLVLIVDDNSGDFDGDSYVFMNNETYEQIEVPVKVLGENKDYIKEGLGLIIDSYEGEIINITLPEKVEYEVVETEPAVKGNTATNASKDAKVETGLVVRVPLFINQGEKILISTKDGKYAGRA